MPERLVTDLDRLLSGFDRFELRTTPALHNTYDMIDRRDVCVYVADPFERDSILGTVRIADPEFVRTVDTQQRAIWNAATGVECVDSQ